MEDKNLVVVVFLFCFFTKNRYVFGCIFALKTRSAFHLIHTYTHPFFTNFYINLCNIAILPETTDVFHRQNTTKINNSTHAHN